MTDPAATTWDAIVIGAGPAGILAWQQLRRRGMAVLLLEAGGNNAGAAAVDEARWRFRTATGKSSWLRSHAVGGRSALWGGWASTFPRAVFEAGGWPTTRSSLAPDYRRASDWLRVAGGPVHHRYRPIARKLGWRATGCASMARDDSPWLRARSEAGAAALTSTVGCALVSQNGHAVALQAVDRAGTSIELRARRFLLAASPIESARLLLASGARHPAIGHGLTDHSLLSYVLLDRQPKRSDLAASQMHGALIDPFGGARPFGRAHRGRFTLEVMGPVPLSSFSEPWLHSQGIEQSPSCVATYIHAMGEQFPRVDRRVALAARARDSLGRRIPVLHLGLGADDRALLANMREACLLVAETLAHRTATLVPVRDSAAAPVVYHPAGTCAMGRTEDAPCDPWGRLREWSNVWLCDASVLPTSGDRHPTLTVLAHTLRAVDNASRGPA